MDQLLGRKDILTSFTQVQGLVEELEQVLAVVLVPESAEESSVPVVALATVASDQAGDWEPE